MIPQHTPAVARALAMAYHLARRNGCLEMSPVHLLGALLEEEEGRPAVLCTAAGLPRDLFRRHFGELVLEEGFTGPAPPLPLADSVVRIFTDAWELAGELSDDRIIASEHLLLALLRQETELRSRLADLGLQVTRLTELLKRSEPEHLALEVPLELSTPTEEIDTLRILDAAGNRAREALRVVEDYCRFVLDDRLLSGQLKQLRHDLTECCLDLVPSHLTEARDTVGDVGTTLSTNREYVRATMQAVVEANLKRLEEALRSLEEFAKVRFPHVAAWIEQLRYRTYTLEKAVLIGAVSRQRLARARLYVLLTASQCNTSLDWIVREAAAGGADIFQLREKTLPDAELLKRAQLVRRLTRQSGTLFIMNDRPDLARIVDADGVHLGQEDLPVKEARRILGSDKLIGVSTHNLDQVRKAVLDGANYIGVGPTFPSQTKQFESLAGLEFVRQACQETSLPAFVLGGIHAQNLPAVLAAGGRRIAVSRAICAAEEPRAAAQELRQLLDACSDVRDDQA